jgi:3-methyl-2-oxobutanoate hydroxymethyltransferase
MQIILNSYVTFLANILVYKKKFKNMVKKIYTWGGKFAERNLTVDDLLKAKGRRKFIQTTATSAEEAEAAKEADFDLLLCKSPNIKNVRSGAPNIFLTATIDLSNFPTENDVLNEAFRAMKEGADQVYTARGPHIVELLAKEDIPVMCHLGLVPRKSGWRGGLRAVGANADEALKLYNDFKTMENAGAFSVESEVIHEQIMTEISKRTQMLVSSLGSGWNGDIIYLFQNDICGEEENLPRHARAFGNIYDLKQKIKEERISALKKFKSAVLSKDFPNEKEIVKIKNEELDKFLEHISK